MIGVITAHTEAPREFSDDEVDFLVTSASLVASAIENARLYEEAQLRVAELEQLTELKRSRARTPSASCNAVEGARPLLAAKACHVYLSSGERRARARRPAIPSRKRQEMLGLAELRPGARPRRLQLASRRAAGCERRADRLVAEEAPASSSPGRREPSGRRT